MDVKIKLLEQCEQHWKAVMSFILWKKQNQTSEKKKKEKTKETEEENSSGHMKWDLEERILQAWT